MHTYMNDVRIGVPVIGAHEKVNQELSSIFLVEPGDDVLQPPVFALTSGEGSEKSEKELNDCVTSTV